MVKVIVKDRKVVIVVNGVSYNIDVNEDMTTYIQDNGNLHSWLPNDSVE